MGPCVPGATGNLGEEGWGSRTDWVPIPGLLLTVLPSGWVAWGGYWLPLWAGVGAPAPELPQGHGAGVGHSSQPGRQPAHLRGAAGWAGTTSLYEG